MADEAEQPAPEVTEEEAPPAHEEAVAAPAAAVTASPFDDINVRLKSYASTWRKTGDSEMVDVEVEYNYTDVTDGDPNAPKQLHQEALTQTVDADMKVEKAEVDVQTDPMAPETTKPILDGESFLWPSGAPDTAADDVLGFVEEKGPLMDELVEWNAHTHAFSGYSPQWIDSKRDMDVVADLHAPEPTSHQLQALDVAWNCTGSVVAAAYGRMDNVGWCTSVGFVCAWNVNSPRLKQDVPDVCVEVSNHVMVVAFHPTERTHVAAGTYNGDVVLYDLGNREEPLLASSRTGQSHTDPVKCLRWVRNASDFGSRPNLLSAAGDGKVIVWSAANSLARPLALYEPVDKGGRVLGVTSVAPLYSGFGAGGATMAAVLDVSSLENAVVAGTETGRVLRCAIKPVDKVPELPRNEKGEVDYTKDVKLVPKNPIIATHSAHTGPVQSVDGSRFHRHLFLSASSDGNVHISNALESERMLVLSPASSLDAYIYSAAWSPYRPLVFAAGSRNSYVYIYDLEQSRVRPAISQRAGVDAIVCVRTPIARWVGDGSDGVGVGSRSVCEGGVERGRGRQGTCL